MNCYFCVNQSHRFEVKRIVDLVELVRLKLNSFRDQDRTHLRDINHVGLIDAPWPAEFEPVLEARLQELLDDPDG